MNLNEIVASYAKKDGKEVIVNLEKLSQDANFKSEVIAAIHKALNGKSGACVFFPSQCKNNQNLGQLINEIAASAQVKTLVTGSVENLKSISNNHKKEVVLIKQAFDTGVELAEQIAAIKKMGAKVSVLCLVSHSNVKLKRFAANHDVEMTALVYTNEL